MRRIGHWIGWTTGAPFSGTSYEGAAIAYGTCGHEVKVVAGDHENLAGLQGEPLRRGVISIGVGLVGTDHLARDDAVPDNIVLTRHINDQRGAQNRERGHDIFGLEARQ